MTTQPVYYRSVMQDWVNTTSMMMQSVLLTAVRGPDGLPKYHPSKYLLRWFRRCILLSAMDGAVLDDPVSQNGGSFTGPSVTLHGSDENMSNAQRITYVAEGALRDGSYHGTGIMDWQRDTWQDAMSDWVTAYIRGIDEVPHHFQLHFMHAIEIIGYKHPNAMIGQWWLSVYVRLAKDMHLNIETEESLDHRLGDSREQWLAHGDEATND